MRAASGRVLVPRPSHQKRQKLSIVVLQVSLLRQMKEDLPLLEVGNKFQTTLTLDYPFVASGVVILVLEQVFMRPIFQGDLGCLSMPLSENYLLGQVQEFVSLTPMHGGLSSLCRFCGEKCLRGIVLLLWTSSSIATNIMKSVSPWVFINSQLGVQIVD